MLAMVIGCYSELTAISIHVYGLNALITKAFALGIALRIGLHFQPQGTGLYIAEYLFVVLSVSDTLGWIIVITKRHIIAMRIYCGDIRATWSFGSIYRLR